MVKFARGLVAVAAAAATALGATAVAVADDPLPEGALEGIYTFHQNGASATWKIYPLCVPTVGPGRVPLQLAVGCKLQVESDGAIGQSGAYRLAGGRWTYSIPLLAGKKCANGHTVATEETYQFDTALNGTYSQAHNAVCGGQPGIDKTPFTLTYVGPLPVPVNRYPLTCQDNPVHLCS
ncbi:MAG: hypothetical protein ABI307_07555 [Mycobacterium sp.]